MKVRSIERCLATCWLVALLAAHPWCQAGAAEPRRPTPAQAMNLLKANCLSCHNEEKKKGGLLLTTRESALGGGDSGAALAAGEPENSLILELVQSDGDPHMPPKKQLSPAQIAMLRAWIEDGAQWDAAALESTQELLDPLKLGPLPDSYAPVLALALSPDESRLAAGHANRVTVYHTGEKDFPTVAVLEGARDAVQSLAWAPAGEHLAAGEFRRVLIWSGAEFGAPRELTNSLQSRVTALQFTADGKALLIADSSAAQQGLIHLWPLGEDQPANTWLAHGDTIFDLEPSPDGKLLATASADGHVKLWNLETQEEVARLEGHTSYVLALAFRPDNSMLATGSADKSLKIWDVTTREQKINLTNHRRPVTALAWPGDGDTLVSICEEGLPRAFTEFKVHEGTQRSGGAKERALTSAGEILYALAATADAKRVFAGGYAGLVYVWGEDGKIQAKLGSEPATPPASRAEAALKN